MILFIDWLHACYASIDYKTWVVNFQFVNEPILEWKGGFLRLEVNLYPTFNLER